MVQKLIARLKFQKELQNDRQDKINVPTVFHLGGIKARFCVAIRADCGTIPPRWKVVRVEHTTEHISSGIHIFKIILNQSVIVIELMILKL